MAQRSAHGTARDLGRLTVSECCPADELPAADGTDAEPAPAARDPVTGQWVKGNRAGELTRLKAGKYGALRTLVNTGDDAARAAMKFGRKYASHRRAELTTAHGAISAGVAAMVESAGQLLAQARYWQARGVAEGNADHARLAAQLIAGSRQAERDAWELASREAAARKLTEARRGRQSIAALLAQGESNSDPAPALGPPGRVDAGTHASPPKAPK